MIEVKSLSKSFGGIRAVDNVSLSIGEKIITSIIGPNGAGKTTLFNLISGFLPADRGMVMFRGEAITGLPAYQVARRGIARTFQDLRLIRQATVLENILLAGKNQKGEKLLYAFFWNGIKAEETKFRDAAYAILAFVGLKEHANLLAGKLSYGEQKLLTLGCCLAMGADVFLLDEPVSGIHPEIAEKILALFQDLAKRGKTVVFIEHDIEAVRKISDTVVVLDEGRVIAEGKPEAVLHDPAIVEVYLD